MSEIEDQFLGRERPRRNQSLRLGNRLVARDISESLGKLPPQALDLEEAVLGAVLLERSAQVTALELLKPEHFYAETHVEIFNAIVLLATEGHPIDMRTVVNKLQKLGKIELVGGPYYIAELTSKVSSGANVGYHAHMIIEKSILRELIQFASQIHNLAYEDTTDVFELLNDVKRIPLQIAEGLKGSNITSIKEGIDHLTKSLNEDKGSTDSITGVPSGFTAIDRITFGWQPTDLIIIAARPSVGKTTFVINCGRNAAVDFKIPVAIFSLEMSTRQITNKFVSLDTEIALQSINSKQFGFQEWEQFHATINPLYQAPIFIDDTAALSILDLRIRCRQMVEKHGVGLIIVDYLQLMRGEYVGKGGSNREQEISSISRGLKATAKELNVPVLALSQLSRKVEERPLPKLPILADLRESGSLEQDADVVGFLWRAEVVKVTGDSGGTFIPGLTRFIIAKHRNGELGEPAIGFNGKTSKFRNIDSPYFEASGTITKQAGLFDRTATDWTEPKAQAPINNDDETPF